MSAKDRQAEKEIQLLLDEARIPVGVVVEDGVARLIGSVTTPRLRQAAIDLASTVKPIRRIDDEMDFEIVAPETATELQDDDDTFAVAGEPTLEDAPTEVEPDFQLNDEPRDDSTLDFAEEIEDEETYFPPTDPVVGTTRTGSGLEVIGGFQEVATDDTDEEETEAYDESVALADGDRVILRDDEDIRDDVIRELREDALTTDLELTVDVRRGVVFLTGTTQSIDDAENAQDVASRVAGVIDVEDRTETEA
ncbi:MAG TPA: BON domain-containing protein [Nitrolancea sp.]|jgi:osmotically-inducible protein OsmY|nr:BON domain-containing protein [Nitrolancea sp.]